MLKVLLFFIPLFLFGAEVNIAETDIVYRSINFVIFIALLWYLFADKFKVKLSNRRDSIAQKLKDVQNQLEDSISKKQDALKALEFSKRQANDIIANAKKEASILARDIDEQCKNELKILNQNFSDRMEFETRKMRKNIIAEVLDELLGNGMKISKEDYIEILSKKVA